MTEVAAQGVPVPLGTGRSLSAMQRSLWASQLNHPLAPVQNMPLLSFLDGTIDAERLAAAFATVVAGSDALRTRLTEAGGRSSGQWGVELIPLEHLPTSEVVAVPRDEVERWARARGAAPLDMAVAGYDSAIAVHEDGTVSWYLNLHHVITDATSSALVFHATARAYDTVHATASDAHDTAGNAPEGGSSGSGTPSYYRWARKLSANLEHPADPPTRRAIEHWRSRDPAPRIGRLYTPVQDPTPMAERVTLPVGPELLGQAEERLSAEYRMLTADLGWSALLVTATAAYCHRVTGAVEFAVGLPVHNRSDPAVRELIGPTMEVFPVDVVIELDDTFASLHKRISRAVLATLRHAVAGTSPAADYEAVVNVIPRAEQQHFGSVAANTRWLHSGAIDAGHLLRVQMTGYGGADDSSTGPEFALDINHGGADPEHRSRAAGHFLTVVADLVGHPERSIGARTLCGPDELDLLGRWESEPDFPDDTALIPDRLRSTLAGNDAIVIEQPGVDEADRSLTGAELWRWITAAAGQLQADGVGRGDRVGIDLPRSIEAVVAIMAVMAAGGSFVPLDPSQPSERRRSLAERARCRIVLSSVDDVAALRPQAGSAPDDSAPDETAPSDSGWREDDEAYLLFTSGSTGEPKGVPITAGGLAHYIRFARESYVPTDRPPLAPLFSPLTFDLTITSLFLPILAGGRLVVVGPDGPSGLSMIAKRPEINWCKATPSHLEILVRLLRSGHELSTLVVGGEAFGTRLAADLRAFNPELRIFNEYGPTEAVVGCMIHELEPGPVDDQAEVPIGRPAPGVTLLIVDEHLRRVPIGAPGELCIAHRGLTSGYLGSEGSPERPDDAFVEIDGRRFYRSGDLVRLRNPTQLVYLGRKDEQVKVGGIRLEPMEVEGRLNAHPAVARSAVRVWSPSFAQPTHHCPRCGLPDNVPGVDFDAEGICQTCHDHDRVAPITESWFKTTEDLKTKLTEARAARTGEHDCVHLLSGGKDSTYALYRLVALGFKPYALTLDNGFISEGAKENVRRSVADLGIDHEFATTEAMNAIFRDSLERYSNVCHGCYKTIYTVATNKAAEIGAPLIVTGLSRGQLFETRLIPQQFSAERFDPDAIDRAVLEARKLYHRVDDGPNRLLDSDIFGDDEIFDRIEYLDFYRYVDVELSELLRFLDEQAPWVRPDDTGRSTNCLVNAAGIHTHQTEQGYHNYAVPYAWDVRLGHKTRSEAIAELDDRIDRDEVDDMLAAIGYRPRPREVLTAWIEPTAGPDSLPSPAELRAFLAETLPAHAIPSAFVEVDGLPLSANGKLDQRALPGPTRIRRPGPTLQLGADPRAETVPMSSVERTIVELWERILQLEPIAVDDDFFALGGDSLAALEMIVALGELQGRHLGEELAFTHTTPSELAGAIELLSGDPVNGEPVPGEPVPGAAGGQGSGQHRVNGVAAGRAAFTTPADQPPARSPGELAVLFDQAARPDDPMYNVARLYLIDGPVDGARFERALRTVAARHQPLSWSHGTVRRPLAGEQAVAFTASSEVASIEEVENRIGELHRAPFDLDRGPLLRCLLQPLADGTTALALAIHHVSGDAASFSVLLEQIDDELVGVQPSQALDYAGFCGWQQERQSDDDRRYWLSSSGPAPAAGLAVPRPSPAEPDGFVTRRASVTVAELRAGAHRSPAAIAVASVVAALRHHSDGSELELGLITSTRNDPEADALFGYFLNTVPLRVRCDHGQHLDDLARRTAAAMGGALAHRTYPLARIAADRRETGGPAPNPAALVAFDELHTMTVAGTTAHQRVLWNGSAVAPLTFFIELRDDQVELSLEHRGSVVCSATAQSMLAAVDRAMTAAVSGGPAGTGAPTIAAAGPTDAELSLLIGPPLEDDGLIPARIAEHLAAARVSAEHPPAVICGDDRLSWADLDRRSATIAEVLCDNGVTAGDRVVVCLPRSINLVAAVVAIHRMGAAYVPIDPTYPDDRIRSVAERAGATVGLVDAAHNTLVERSLPVDDSSVAGRGWSGPAEPEADTGRAGIDVTVAAADTAYIIFTSGSTGEPRGVAVNHRNLAASTTARADVYPAAPERFLLLSSAAFDSSIVGLFWTLANGGTVVLPTEDQVHDLVAVSRLLRSGVTHTLMVPTLYQGLLDLARRRPQPRRQPGPGPRTGGWPDQVIVAGEACQPALVESHFELFPDSSLTNEYGPTETSVWATAHHCSPGDDPVPIGPPIPGSWVAVVEADTPDRSVVLRPRGVEGELIIGGLGVVDGYLADPDADRQRFSALPADSRPAILDTHPNAGTGTGTGTGRFFLTGDRAVIIDDEVHFLGREDNQLNIGGSRAEPEEIENVLLGFDGVSAAVVVAADLRSLPELLDTLPAAVVGRAMAAAANHDDPARTLQELLRAEGESRTRLVAHIEASPDRDPDPDQLRRRATDELPPLLRPAHYQIHRRLPTTPNGKLDRSAAQLLPVDVEGPTRSHAPGDGPAEDDRRHSDGDDRRIDELTVELSRLFARTLKLADFEPDQSFFDHGGHSLLAMELLLALEDRYQRRVSASSLYAAPTPRELAVRLAGEVVESNRSFLVPIQTQGNRPPIFAVHVLGVDCAFFRPLAARLGPDQPMYGLGQPTTALNTTGPSDVAEVAAAYAEEIDQLCPEGPLSLAAISLGGVVAYELAQQLTAKGRRVQLLALFDAFGPEANDIDPGIKARLAAHRQRVRRSPIGYLSEQLDQQGQRVQRSRQRLALALRTRLNTVTNDQLEIRRFIEANVSSQVAYTYDPYPGPILVVKAGDDPLSDFHVEHRMGWGSLAAGGLHIDIAPGRHLSIMAEPNVAVVAQSVERALARAASGDHNQRLLGRETVESMLTAALRLGRLPVVAARLASQDNLDREAANLVAETDQVLADLARSMTDVANTVAGRLRASGLEADVVPVAGRLQHGTATVAVGGDVEHATTTMASLGFLPVGSSATPALRAGARANGYLDYIRRGSDTSRIRLQWSKGGETTFRLGRLTTNLRPTSNDFDVIDLPDWARAGYWAVRPLRVGGDRLRRLRSGDEPADRPATNLGIYLGTPPGLVAALLRFAEIEEGQTVVDIGCGDGRVLIEAAVRFGCRARGYEIDGDLVRRARSAAAEAGVDHLIEVIEADAVGAPMADVDIAFAFLPPKAVARILRPTLQQLATTARFVSHEQLATALPLPPDRTGLVVGRAENPAEGGVTVANLWYGRRAETQ